MALRLATVGQITAHAGNGVRVNAINPRATCTGRLDGTLETAMHSRGRHREERLPRSSQTSHGLGGNNRSGAFSRFIESRLLRRRIISMDGAKTSTMGQQARRIAGLLSDTAYLSAM